jgi:hypothetical protein
MELFMRKRKKSKDPLELEKRKPNLPEKIIFLDVDGVLNNVKSDCSRLYVMEPALLGLLKKLLQAVPGSALVLSTTWRLTPTSRAQVLDFFKANNVPRYISCTPNLGTNRVDEILCWLQDNTDFDESGIQKIGLPTKLSKFDEGVIPIRFDLFVLTLQSYRLLNIYFLAFMSRTLSQLTTWI